MTMNLFAGASVALWIVISSAAPAGAHAFLERADPRVGSTMKMPPTEVRLWFTDDPDPQASRVQVVDQAGQRVDNGDTRVDTSNHALLRVSLPTLIPGLYKVIWRVVSPDGQVSAGDFTFRIAQ
jgi:copper resistance protein C